MNKKAESKTIKTNRYDFILKLGEGGMGAVYKVVDRLTGLLVALKEIKVEQVRKKDDFETLTEEELALMNEFQILSSLRHPNIVSVLDYGLDEEMPYFTMELLAAPQNLTEFTKGKSRAVKIHMLVQLLQALAYLHHRNIIHRDLKPANILIDGNGVLKVLDFGIALAQDYLVPAQDSLSGTLAYLAPEVLQGTPVSFASDLYAFGVIAYEVLTEKYPYQYNHIGNLLEAIIHNRVDVSLLDDDIAVVVGRLLEKDPADRYQEIDKLIKDFVDASKYEMPVETLAIRESFLNAASFVGREEYFRQLKGLLSQAIEGQGQVCLVAGESGVGKSRLLSELRVLALVERVLVLRGQAVATAGSPYHLWRHIFRYLIIMSELSDTEGSIMGTIVSDIDMLLGREVDSAADLAPNAVRERFESTVLNIFRRQKLPILLILEDLHWADEESLALVKRLSEIASSLPIFILCSYRNDESPDLPRQFPQAQVITLERFDIEKMARLSSALLGKIGQEPKLVQFLYNETAGNVFFAIEVIRVLANQVGNLRDISQMALPSEITAGGVLAVLRQRLERIPAEHYPLVQYAALYGRELDLSLLRHLMPEHNHEQWFEVLSQLSIIEVEDNIWRFSHDKLREEVVRKLETDGSTLQNHHQKLALALEACYPDSKDYISALAFHWAGAKVPDKAVSYSEKAAEVVYLYAPKRAIKHIETAISFEQNGSSLSKERRVMRHAILGRCHYFVGKYDEALQSLENMVEHLGASPMPGNAVLGVFALLSQTAIHTAHRLLPGQFLAKAESEWLPESTLISLYDMTIMYMAQGKMPQALYSILMNVNFIETLKPGSKSNPVIGYAWLHFALGLTPLRGLSNYYRAKVLEILEDKEQTTIMPMIVKGAAEAALMVSDFYNARWENVVNHIQVMIQQVEAIGDLHSFDLALYYRGIAYQLMGRFADAEAEFHKAYLQSTSRNDIEMRFSHFSLLSALLLKTGQYGEETYAELQKILEKDEGSKHFAKAFETNRLNEALYLALQSSLAIRQNKAKDAFKALDTAAQIIKNQSFEPNPSYFLLYEMILMNARSLLSEAAFKQTFNSEEQKTLLGSAKAALKLIKQASGVMVFAEPLHHLGQAWISNLEGKNEPARPMAQKAIVRADELALPYYKALAQLTLAESSNPVDTKLQQEALEALEKMGLRTMQLSQ